MLKKDFYDLNENGNIGDWAFSDDGLDLYICYGTPSSYEGEPPYPDIIRCCVCTNENMKSWPRLEKPWLWNGNKECPTITPSINVVGRWHGFLTDGKLITV